MPEPWTGRLIGIMHNNGITYQDVADHIGVSKSYVCMLLNSARKPPKARERLDKAVSELIAAKKA